jgi:DNA-binding MarR family transcriptional regulator
MAGKDDIIRDGIDTFLRIVNIMRVLERTPVDFGTGEMLTVGEIHTIEAIGPNAGVNITDLASRMHVTKGAMSQVVSRLDGRGYVTKTMNRGFGNEVTIELTARGKKAYRGHRAFHHRVRFRCLESLGVKDLSMMREIMHAMERELIDRGGDRYDFRKETGDGE